MLYLKWPTIRGPRSFRGPYSYVLLSFASVFAPLLLAVTVLLPQLIYPMGLRLAVTSRQPACVLDPYVQ